MSIPIQHTHLSQIIFSTVHHTILFGRSNAFCDALLPQKYTLLLLIGTQDPVVFPSQPACFNRCNRDLLSLTHAYKQKEQHSAKKLLYKTGAKTHIFARFFDIVRRFRQHDRVVVTIKSFNVGCVTFI